MEKSKTLLIAILNTGFKIYFEDLFKQWMKGVAVGKKFFKGDKIDSDQLNDFKF